MQFEGRCYARLQTGHLSEAPASEVHFFNLRIKSLKYRFSVATLTGNLFKPVISRCYYIMVQYCTHFGVICLSGGVQSLSPLKFRLAQAEASRVRDPKEAMELVRLTFPLCYRGYAILGGDV